MKAKTVEEIVRRYKRGDKEFKGAIIKEGNFSKLRLNGIVFEGATLVDCNFEQSLLQHARFSAANLRGASFRGANLAKADLKGADFRGAIMRAVNLNGADLRWANLEGVDLSGSIIAGANFDGANLKNASLKNTDPGKWWWKANLDEAKLDNTTLPDGTIFSQPDAIEPRPLSEPEPVEPTQPVGPDYAQADRLYLEGLGLIGSLQSQQEVGTPMSHPRMQRLIQEAIDKFSDAIAISDPDWPRYAVCNRYVAELTQDTKSDAP